MNQTFFRPSIIYDIDETPIVSSMSPIFGSTRGGDEITINGLRFGNRIDKITVKFDNVTCIVTQAFQEPDGRSILKCITGARKRLAEASFELIVNS